MPQDRFLIAPLTDGLQNNVKPWLISDQAFAVLQNLYLFRGRVRKRFGVEYMGTGQDQKESRLRVNLGATNGAGTLAGTVPGNVFAVGQMFSVGSVLFTVVTAGAVQQMLRTDLSVAVATYSTTNGAFNITGAAALTTVYFYPGLPVMGLTQFETELVNEEFTIGFDTRFAYRYLSTGWTRLAGEATPGAALWSGNDTNFFWSTNYRGPTDGVSVFFTTNNYFNTGTNAYDGVRYFDEAAALWHFLLPQYSTSANDIIVAALIVVPFQNRLLLLNIVEQTGAGPFTYQRYVNRVAYSSTGDPTSAVQWDRVTPGRGGKIDCPTPEAIVTVEFIKNRLIVGFEKSTWELVYTGNQVTPFVWQELNTEYGSESTFSAIPFDKYMLSIGQVGVMSCNGSNVQRIDDLIPDEVFNILDGSDGVIRVYGIRDYFTELVYWTFPTSAQAATSIPRKYPTRVLVYNYKANTWSFFDDSITCFGYFQIINTMSWEENNNQWEEENELWVDPTFQSGFRAVIGGNQEGYTFVCNTGENSSRNAGVLQITNVNTATRQLTIIDHNLIAGDYILPEGAVGLTGLNDIITQVLSIVDANNIIIEQPFSGTYAGGGTVARVSPLVLTSKQYNFYVEKLRNAYISKIDFLVTRTPTGAITVDSYISSSNFSLLAGGQATGALVGTNVLETSPYALYPFESQQDRLWHSLYLQAEGETVQFSMYFSDAQMRDKNVSLVGFELHAFAVTAMSTSDRLQ
jgi:hypothetical protein